MKPTPERGAQTLLTTADCARIRKLRNEKARILARLRELGELELAIVVQPQVTGTQIDAIKNFLNWR